MTGESTGANGELIQAATLAFAMLRFEEGASHPPTWHTPPGLLKVGTEGWIFAPSRRVVPRDEVPAFLTGLGSPALLFPSTLRGIVTLLRLDELAGERRAAAEHALRNQRAVIEDVVGQYQVADEACVLLQFDEEEHVVPLAVLRVWSDQFLVHIRWNLRRAEAEPRAAVRLMLFRSDNVQSWGGSCPVRRNRDRAT